jgi:glycosyltransferase involved in cell wall biosynthesis
VYHSTTSFGPLRRRCPVVITLHDATAVTMPYHRGPGDRAFRSLFSVQSARRADAILAPTRAAADEVSAAYGVPASRIHVAHLGVTAAFHEVTRAAVERVRARYGLRFPYVLYVGAEPPRKNLARLVEAFAALASRCPDVHLVLAGPERSRDHTVDARVRRAGLDARVHRLDGVTRDDLPAIHAGAACLAFVSLCEGFGLPVVEAMAAGTPVVTSNRSAMPEVAGGAALLVDPLSVDAIAEGIGRVLGDTGLADELRRKGRIRSEAFDWSETAAGTERVYGAVAGA